MQTDLLENMIRSPDLNMRPVRRTRSGAALPGDRARCAAWEPQHEH